MADHDISDLPDACLARIFHFLGPGDRNRCSLVSRCWLKIDGQSRHRLSLNAQSDLISVVQPLFSRFDAVTKLSLKCDPTSFSIHDDALIMISQRCQNLIRVKLRSCRQLTDYGIENLARNCRKLKKFSAGSCSFGAKGMNAVVDNCSFLEEITVRRLQGFRDGNLTELIKPGVAASSLKIISLMELYNGQCFEPLIVGSKGLKTLRVISCDGDWDNFLQLVTSNVDGLIEIYLAGLQVSDSGLAAVSSCQNLEILHLLKTTGCSNLGVGLVAENCKFLRKIHIDGRKKKRIDDQGLTSVAKNCSNLQELVLISVDITHASLDLLCRNCRKLKRLILCKSKTIGDDEICCIAAKCTALRLLYLKSCAVSDRGMEALAVGCLNLVKVKVKKCKGVTSVGAGWLKASRESLTVYLDSIVVENKIAITADWLQAVKLTD